MKNTLLDKSFEALYQNLDAIKALRIQRAWDELDNIYFLKDKRNEFVELLEQFNTDIKYFVKTNLELATKKRKIKKTAILLSFPFLPVGMFGLHKFYLGQIGYGVLYIFLNFLWISPILALINFIQLIVISQEKFDVKYNPVFSYYSQFNFDE